MTDIHDGGALNQTRVSMRSTDDAATLAAIERFSALFDTHDADALATMLTEDTIFENTGPAPDGTPSSSQAS